MDFKTESIFCGTDVLLDFPALINDELLAGLAGPGAEALDLGDDVHALDDLAKDGVAAVEPVRLGRRDKELAAVGVGAGVGHGEQAGAGVLQAEVLVAEGAAVDRLATRAVVICEIATLK